jgi:hypothetical protein
MLILVVLALLSIIGVYVLLPVPVRVAAKSRDERLTADRRRL